MTEVLIELGVPGWLAVLLVIGGIFFLAKHGNTPRAHQGVDTFVKWTVYLIGAGVLVAILYGCYLIANP